VKGSPTDERLQRVLRKARWAHEQCGRLYQEIRAFEETKPYALVCHQEAEGRHHVFTATNIQPVPEHISLIIGDAAHAARTCLDHLAWALAQSPNDRTSFPIWDAPKADREGNERHPTIAGGISNECRTLLKQVQPYSGGKNPRASPLVWLRELDNLDKHRFVVAGIATHESSDYGFVPDISEVDAPDMFPTWGVLLDGEEVCRFVFSEPKPDQHIEFHIAFEVGVRDVQPVLDQQPIVSALMKGLREVEDIAEQFKTFLKR
jgi:hypothetical protein